MRWAIALFASLVGPGLAEAGTQAPGITYVLPQLLDYLNLSDADFAHQVGELKSRLGEGRLVRVGFTMYIRISMDDPRVDIGDPGAVHDALASTVDQIDRAIARARVHDIPVCLAFLTAIRRDYDPFERASELEDRRNTQWYTDNALAEGWLTHSQYARKQRAIQEAYIRGVGRVLADRVNRFPETVVAAAGDGEVELSWDRAIYTPGSPFLADYTPFAVAEFRDWLRQGGLYASGQPLAGQAHSSSGRYAGDASPAIDTNGDGHTLNGDFGVSFTSWQLRYFDWSLADDPWRDPGAIPSTTYGSPGWNALPDAGSNRFDAPRIRARGNAWWETWVRFKQEMIWRHTRDFARWITTSVELAGGTQVPAERWYSYQIPADFLWDHTPEEPDWRLETSASPWWTADVAPYGSLGITAFNVNYGGGSFGRTLANLAPHIGQLGRRWGILEWSPSIPFSATPDIYRAEMAIIEQYRPSLLVPWAWNDPNYRVEGTGFEVALRELIQRLRGVPDADGDGKANITVYRGSTGEWFTRRSSDGSLERAGWGSPLLGDVPVPDDYDGDGRTDLAVYRRSSGAWLIRRSSDESLQVVGWGSPAWDDVPTPSDYDGDGKADIAVYRRSTGEWFIRRAADGGLTYVPWGSPVLYDMPVPADYDGDGRIDIAVYRRATGEWFIRRAADGGLTYAPWGSPVLGDIPVPADYDGDLRADVAVYRRSTGEWLIRRSTDFGLRRLSWGSPPLDDYPTPADYDGDRKADVAVYRRSTGEWFILRSTDGQLTHVNWGSPPLGDVPTTPY